MKKKELIFNDKPYELIEDVKEGFDEEIVKEKLTDYFEKYDYIIGDWSYNKLRLKGFCEKNNPLNNKNNTINNKDQYLKENCSYQCRYFVLKKVTGDK